MNNVASREPPSKLKNVQVAANWSCWAEVGPKAIQMGSKFKPSKSKLGRSWGLAGQIATPPCTFLQLARANIPPLELKLYQTDRSVHSYHSLLNYHASAPSARADFMVIHIKITPIYVYYIYNHIDMNRMLEVDHGE